MNRLHIQLLLSKWTLTLKRHRSELDEIERETIEYAARLNQPREEGDHCSCREIARAILATLSEERERCAKIAMDHARYWSQQTSENATARTNEAELIADEIRNSPNEAACEHL